MFIGHYGPAIWDGQRAGGMRLWHAILAVQAIDILWVVFSLIGLEGHNRREGLHPLAFDLAWSHSLLSAIVISILVGAIYGVLRPNAGRKAILIMGVLAFSHWPFDWLVHRPDLPIYPGGELLLGLGLWDYPWIALCIEMILYWGMIFWWLFKTRGKLWTLLLTVGFSIVLTGLHVSEITMPTVHYQRDGTLPVQADNVSLLSALFIFIVAAAVIGFVERHRDVKSDRP